MIEGQAAEVRQPHEIGGNDGVAVDRVGDPRIRRQRHFIQAGCGAFERADRTEIAQPPDPDRVVAAGADEPLQLRIDRKVQDLTLMGLDRSSRGATSRDPTL